MAATAALSFPISIKKDSPYIAGLSVIIAFFTPILLSSGKDMYGFLFAYIAFVNSAAFAVGIYKKWPIVIRLALILTFLFVVFFQVFDVYDRLRFDVYHIHRKSVRRITELSSNCWGSVMKSLKVYRSMTLSSVLRKLWQMRVSIRTGC
jgi:hypothetical protein